MSSEAIVAIGLGLLLLAIGALLLWLRWRKTARAALMAVGTSSASEARAKPAGTLVEVSGTLVCEAPLTSEFAGAPCAYHRSTVTHIYDQRVRDDGQWRTDRESEVISANERRVPFAVRDTTGLIPVNPQGAEIEAVPVHDQTEPSGDALTNLAVGLAASVLHLPGRRTVGYRREEAILPLNVRVYVLGVVGPDGAIGAAGRGQAFVISHRSEGEILASLASSGRWLGIAAAITLLVGVALVGGGLVAR